MTPFRNLRTSCASALLVAAASCALGTPGCAHLRRDKVTSDEVVACRQLSREGVAALERGDCTRARELLDQAVAASPSDLEARRELAEVLWQEGSHQEAMVHMEAAVRLDPRHAPTLVRSGEMLLAFGAADRALARAGEAVALDPTLGSAWALRGRVLRRKGDLEPALADMQQSLRYNPHDAAVLVETAELQYQLGRPHRCLTTVHQLLDAYPPGEEPRRALWLEGLAFGAVDRREDAVRSLAAASRQGAPDPDLLYQLARAQHAAGHPGEAAEAARQALAASGGHEASRALLAQLESADPAGGGVIRR